MFYYPEHEQENYVVNQYVNAEAGAQGLAEIVKEISDAAIKVITAHSQCAQAFHTHQAVLTYLLTLPSLASSHGLAYSTVIQCLLYISGERLEACSQHDREACSRGKEGVSMLHLLPSFKDLAYFLYHSFSKRDRLICRRRGPSQ